MRSFGVLSASGRRALMTLGVAALVGVTSASSAVSARQAAAPPDPFKFSLDAPVMIVAAIKSAKAADFQAGWSMIRSEIESSTRPEVKEFGATIAKLYKVDLSLLGQPPAADAPVNFILQIDAPSKTQSYSPTAIIYLLLWKNGEEGGIPRAKADEIWGKLKPAYDDGQIAIWPLAKAG